MENPNPVNQPQTLFFPTEKKELWFGLGIVVCALALINFLFFGGFNLGFAAAAVLCICVSTAYLMLSGRELGGYTAALLALSIGIAAGFARSDDGFVKFVMACFLFVAVNLALCLMVGQNRRSPNGVATLLDAPRAFYMLGFGKLPEAFRGLADALKNGGTASKRATAVLLGVVIAVPVLIIVVLLLVSADAAFAGLMDKLPDFDFVELFVTALFGGGMACVLYTRGVALRHAPKAEAPTTARKGMHPLTVNTVLIAVCFVYMVYLLSQLAYFVGGFAGILPEGFTMAEYARRGFFEMAWLCAINLGVIALAVGIVEKTGKTPLLTRILCLFIGLVTLFFVVTASAKMAMYIGSYGLTRLRVLTEVIMVFLGLATVLVCVWLFAPKMPYMKVVLLLALVMGAAVLWADVDTVVASYNVRAYQSGKLNAVDVGYLSGLSDGAVPYIAKLTQDGNETVAWQASWALEHRGADNYDDLRSWNWADWIADKIIGR